MPPSSARRLILAPADKRLYGIRDVTATVESVPLITASILSKKLAAGLQMLVLDVKTGSGAFMAKKKDAVTLANSLVKVANGAGLKTSALITDMDEPLASAAGNAVEIKNAVDYLTGAHRDPRLHEVTISLGAELLVLAKIATAKTARAQLEKTLTLARPPSASSAWFQPLAAPMTLSGTPKSICQKLPSSAPSTPRNPARSNRLIPAPWALPSLNWAAAGAWPPIKSIMQLA